MRYITFLFAFLMAVPAFSQVRPDQFFEITNPNNSNFELYSQKAGVPRRAQLVNVKKYMVPFVTDTLAGVPSATGNTANLGEFVWDQYGALWYIDGEGDAISFTGGGPIYVTADTTAEIVVYAPSHGLTDTIALYGYVPVQADFTRANSSDADSVFIAYAIDAPTTDSLTLVFSGVLSYGTWHGKELNVQYYLQDDGSEATTPGTVSMLTAIASDSTTLFLREVGVDIAGRLRRIAMPSPLITAFGGNPSSPTDAVVQAAIEGVYLPAGLAQPGTVFTLNYLTQSRNPTYQQTAPNTNPLTPSYAWLWDGAYATRIVTIPTSFDLQDNAYGTLGTLPLLPIDSLMAASVPTDDEVALWLDTNYTTNNIRIPNGSLLYFVGAGTEQNPDYIWHLIDDVSYDTADNDWERILKRVSEPATDAQTIAFDTATAQLSITGGNTISLDGLFAKGSGSAATIPMWVAWDSLGNSAITQSGQEITMGLTGSITVPSGTDAQVPVWGAGKLRYNTTTGGFQGGPSGYYLPWADADNWAVNAIPYSDGSKLTSDIADFFYSNDEIHVERAMFGNSLGSSNLGVVHIRGHYSDNALFVDGYGSTTFHTTAHFKTNDSDVWPLFVIANSGNSKPTLLLGQTNTGNDISQRQAIRIGGIASPNQTGNYFTGIGGGRSISWDYSLNNGVSSYDYEAARIIPVTLNTTPGSVDIGLRFYTNINDVLTYAAQLDSAGLTLPLYGSGTLTGTPSTWAAWDADGKFIETTAVDIVAAGGAGNVSGSGTEAYLPIWSSDTLADSKVYQSGEEIFMDATGSLTVPSGTDAQVPVWGAGKLRYNTTAGGFQGGANGYYLPWAVTPNFTAGSVLFAATGGRIQQDNSSIFFDNTNNHFGVGTNSPSYGFHVGGYVDWRFGGTFSSQEYFGYSGSGTTLVLNKLGFQQNNFSGTGTSNSFNNTNVNGNGIQSTAYFHSFIGSRNGPALVVSPNLDNNASTITSEEVAMSFWPKSINVDIDIIDNNFGVNGGHIVEWRDQTFIIGQIVPVITRRVTDTLDVKWIIRGHSDNSLTNFLEIEKGEIIAPIYGSGNITGTHSYSASYDANGKLIEVPEKWGAISTSTDGSGDITVAHGMGTTPTSIQVTVTGTTPYVVTVHSIDATNFTVRFYDMTGAAVTSTAVTATWHCKT